MGFGLDNLPYASVLTAEGHRIAAVRYGDEVLDLTLVDDGLFAGGTLDGLLAAGPAAWARVRARTTELLQAGSTPLVPLADVTPVLGFAVADYADFYASEHHATNAGLILRPGSEPLRPNWKSIPVGYYSRAAGLVASGTPVRRPSGVLDAGTYAPSARLDFEAEVAFVIGAPNTPGEPIAVSAVDEHVFGVCLLDDWSARDIQAFESAPLGPLLGKSFATSISPWITPLAALGHARVSQPAQDPLPLPHLAEAEPPHGLDLDLEIRINGALVARPRFADMYWSYAQLLAHLTSNGAAVRTGDVFASGTVSGPVREQRGCLLELTWNGAQPLTLDDGTARCWLLDGDEVTMSASAGDVTLGDVCGRIVTA